MIQSSEPEPELSENQPLLRDDVVSDLRIYDSTAKPISSITKPQDDEPDDDASDTDDESPAREIPPGFWGVVACLMIGVIVANLSTALVMATFSQIGSEFGRLDDANWMVVGYQLGLLASQPTYGKLSDIFGRKTLLLFAYTLFTAGSLWIGVSTQFWQVIVGRVVSGIGGAGMTSLVSILLNDMLPLRDVAAWRSYVYIAATVGRACGAPLGGFLIDTVGWRWSFLGQVPIALLAIVLVGLRLKVTQKGKRAQTQTLKQRFQRIDFLGALSLAASLSLLLVFLDETGKRRSTQNKLLVGAGVGSVVFGIMFLLVEAYIAREPILSLKVLANRHVVSVYTILGFTTGAQISLVTTISIYFILTLGVSNTNAAARLVFGNVAHALGGLLAGIMVQRTGRYKRATILALIVSTCSLFLISIRWRGNTNIFETAYIAPAGFGVGMINTLAFAALTAGIDYKDQAMATSGFYLSDGLGFLVLSSVANAVLQIALNRRLQFRLSGVKGKEEIIHKVMTNMWYITSLDDDTRQKAVKAFVEALQWDHGLSTVFYAVALFVSVVFLQEFSLEGR
ncbi:hypothetical protein H072_10580 [Dactylellina haptotyla CBS 200.50]|uniref:Major facilitator superfamily (MFS) profile domain-containing protein n=1 Tax=Dactylellina haptotyla (strain CBS 200.50) TaxID=1284197 RepID=S7ZYX3_DACHA|nr:hypothetical protein H072_10580 [Dactylellina haptotyla CBS 200.50]